MTPRRQSCPLLLLLLLLLLPPRRRPQFSSRRRLPLSRSLSCSDLVLLTKDSQLPLIFQFPSIVSIINLRADCYTSTMLSPFPISEPQTGRARSDPVVPGLFVCRRYRRLVIPMLLLPEPTKTTIMIIPIWAHSSSSSSFFSAAMDLGLLKHSAHLLHRLKGRNVCRVGLDCY